MNDSFIPTLPANAIIDVSLGSDYISRLQNVIGYIVDGKSPEELDAYKGKLTDKLPLDAWEESLYTLTLLMMTVHHKAEELGLIVYTDVSDIGK